MESAYFFKILGTTGSVIMCVSSIPQIIRTYRTRRADGLSGYYLAMLVSGMSLILLYALHIGDFVFIFGNCLSLSLLGILIALRWQYRNK